MRGIEAEVADSDDTMRLPASAARGDTGHEIIPRVQGCWSDRAHTPQEFGEMSLWEMSVYGGPLYEGSRLREVGFDGYCVPVEGSQRMDTGARGVILKQDITT